MTLVTLYAESVVIRTREAPAQTGKSLLVQTGNCLVNKEFHPATSGYLSLRVAVIYMSYAIAVIYTC